VEGASLFEIRPTAGRPPGRWKVAGKVAAAAGPDPTSMSIIITMIIMIIIIMIMIMIINIGLFDRLSTMRHLWLITIVIVMNGDYD
jgi:hypothetical protein